MLVFSSHSFQILIVAIWQSPDDRKIKVCFSESVCFEIFAVAVLNRNHFQRYTNHMFEKLRAILLPFNDFQRYQFIDYLMLANCLISIMQKRLRLVLQQISNQLIRHFFDQSTYHFGPWLCRLMRLACSNGDFLKLT